MNTHSANPGKRFPGPAGLPFVALAACVAMLISAYFVAHAPPYTTPVLPHQPGLPEPAAKQNEPPVLGLIPPEIYPETRYRDFDTEEYDLVAQRWMAWFTGLLTCFTGVGVMLLWLTLRDTRKVLEEARRTTDAAVDGAKAAWASEATTRSMGQKQAMAYVYVTGARYLTNQRLQNQPFEDVVYQGFRIVIENIGNTAAKNIQLFPKIDRSTLNQRESNKGSYGNSYQLIKSIAPGHKQEVWIGTDRLLHELTGGDELFFVTIHGEVQYQDVFENQFRSEFKFHCKPDDPSVIQVTSQEMYDLTLFEPCGTS